MTDLDAMIVRAREATVDRAAAERYVRELERWARPAPRRAWLPWLAGGLAAAALVVALWPRAAQIAPIRIGAQVAIVADEATAYRVVRADAGETEIAVDHGAVTARLWPTGRPHRLALTGGGVVAIASGTIYRLAVSERGPTVSVIEGAVEVRTAHGPELVHAGASWPATTARPDPAAERALLALAGPSEHRADAAAAPVDPARDARGGGDGVDAVGELAVVHAGEAPTDAGALSDVSARADASVRADAAARADASVRADATVRTDAAAAPDAALAPTIKDRWRTARLLRGQGRFAEARAACLALADARDATWSPIALVEAIRIELGPLAAPERAIELADRMVREWPRDALVGEARELRCRALRQLGRDGECAAVRP